MAARTGLKSERHQPYLGGPLPCSRIGRETFKLSSDPLFIEKVRDIVGLYLNPPQRALVLCVDEKSQIQALERTAPLLPMRPMRQRQSAGPMTTVVMVRPLSSPPST